MMDQNCSKVNDTCGYNAKYILLIQVGQFLIKLYLTSGSIGGLNFSVNGQVN
jgi:hypothetical protein